MSGNIDMIGRCKFCKARQSVCQRLPNKCCKKCRQEDGHPYIEGKYVGSVGRTEED